MPLVADPRTGRVTHTGHTPPVQQNLVPSRREVNHAMQALRALHGSGSKKYLDVIARFIDSKKE